MRNDILSLPSPIHWKVISMYVCLVYVWDVIVGRIFFPFSGIHTGSRYRKSTRIISFYRVPLYVSVIRVYMYIHQDRIYSYHCFDGMYAIAAAAASAAAFFSCFIVVAVATVRNNRRECTS